MRTPNVTHAPCRIRPLQQEDLGSVAALWDRVLRSRTALRIPSTTEFLERTLLAGPWADPELPSLVYVQDDGRIAGISRKLHSTHGVRQSANPSSVRRSPCRRSRRSRHRCRGPVARATLDGPQDLTVTDTASAVVGAMWEGLGGHTVHLGAVAWHRSSNRPEPRVWSRRVDSVPRGGFYVPPLTRSGASGMLAFASGCVPWRDPLLQQRDRSLRALELTPVSAADRLPAIASSFRLRPVHDESYLASLFDDLDRFGAGVRVSRLVYRVERLLGSYVYLLRRDSISPVLQVVARPRDAGQVLDHLVEDAGARGAAALVGRLEPHMQEALHHRPVFLFMKEARRLVHSRLPELVAVTRSDSVLMTLLDGEWWW